MVEIRNEFLQRHPSSDSQAIDMIFRGPRTAPDRLSSQVTRWQRVPACLAALLLTLSGLASEARTAELHLLNGDRITGEITRRAEGRIHLTSPILGRIVISESEIAAINEVSGASSGIPDPQTSPSTTVRSDPSPAVSTIQQPGAQASGSPKASTSTATPVQAAPGASVSTSEPAKRETLIPKWRGTIEFGFQQEAGRREGISTSLRADAERQRGPNQLTVNVRSLYSQLDDQLISERSDASFRWRRQLSNRVFAQSVTSFLSDNVKEIDQNYEQNAGFGYALIKRDRHVVNVGGGVTGQVRDALKMSQGFAVLGEVFEDYSFRINSRLTFVQDFLAQYSPVSRGNAQFREDELVAANGENRNYRLRLNSALKGKVTESISMSLRFEYDLDNTVIEQSAKADQRLISSIGYAF